MRVSLIVACGVLLTPTFAVAAAGLSDIVATEACWIRAPYALVKCQSEGGRYPARLVRARPMSSDEKWSLFPAGYCGIVPLDTVVDHIDQVAITPRFLVVRDRTGVFWAVALDEAVREPTQFPSLAAANEWLLQHGTAIVQENEFRPFEDVYRESRPPYSVVVPMVLIGSLVVGFVLLLKIWQRRHRRAFRGKA